MSRSKMNGFKGLMLCGAILGGGLAPTTLHAAPPPATWDGLTHVKAKKVDAVYLLPGADFRGYTKVMLDPTEVAFRKDWLRDYNSSSLDLANRMSEADAKKILDKARTGFEDIFHKAYADAGYQVVTEPGPDVLRVRTAVANLYVAAPDRMEPGITRTYSREAGAATVIVEARDSLSGALLGRGVDGRTAGDAGPYIRNRVTNESDFRELFRRWAKLSADGLTELKAMSPVAGPTATARK